VTPSAASGHRRREAKRQQGARRGLGDAGGGGVASARPQADALEGSAGALEAVATEPAEELLGAVADEQRAD